MFDDNDKCAEKPLLEDPNVSVLFEQDTCEGCFEELGPDQILLLEKGLYSVHELLCLGGWGLFESLKNKLIKVVKCGYSICLHFESWVSHSVE